MTNDSNNKRFLRRLLESTQLRLINLIMRREKTEIIWMGRHITLDKLSAITIRRWVTIQTTIQNQKTNLSLNHPLVDG